MCTDSILKLKTTDYCTNYVFLGEAGCGKSELAINFACALAANTKSPIHFFDLDMTKILFRARDQISVLNTYNVLAHYEEQFMDVPALVGGVSEKLKGQNCFTILDVGGDAIGAKAIGGYAKLLNSYSTIYYIINPFRPWSTTTQHVKHIFSTILNVSHLNLSHVHLIANPNLGIATTIEDIIAGLKDVEAFSKELKAIEFLCARTELCEELKKYISYPIISIDMHMTTYQ